MSTMAISDRISLFCLCCALLLIGSSYAQENETATTQLYDMTTEFELFDNTTANSTEEAEEAEEEKPKWLQYLDRLQLVLTVTGSVANVATFLTLTLNGDHFSPMIRLLLKHQAFVDSWACIMGTALMLQPGIWLTGVTAVDFCICHFWHSQTWYWTIVSLSIYNLMLIAAERYVAICFPFKHTYMRPKHIWLTFVGMYIGTFIFLIPSYAQVHYVDGECKNEFGVPGEAGEKLFYAYSIIAVIFIYFFPVGWFVVTYGMVLLSFRKRMQSSTLAASKVIDTANERLTRTAICVTTIFICTIGYDLLYYTLGYTGVTEYRVNEPIQKIGLLLAVLNSVCNPFVYMLLMPAYRLSMRMTFCCYKGEDKKATKPASTVSTVSNSETDAKATVNSKTPPA